MQKNLDSSRKDLEALQLGSNEMKVQSNMRNSSEKEKVERFIHQFERLTTQQKRDFNLTQFFFLDLFVHLKRLKDADCNDALMGYLKVTLLETKEQAPEEAEVTISERVNYNYKLRRG
eukprot:snap_masked-scaffold_9-processed-gene-5.24-mRNA-1 protein AED:1.00 eAED:1.00 QI:0/0/0/0/1/1/2/0/117